MTGPAMATTLPVAIVAVSPGEGAVVVMGVGLLSCRGVRSTAPGGCGGRSGGRWTRSDPRLDDRAGLVTRVGGPERFGATDDLHDLGGAVTSWRARFMIREYLVMRSPAFGGGGHRPLACGQLRRRGVEQGGEDLGLGGPGGEVGEQDRGVGLELGVPLPRPLGGIGRRAAGVCGVLTLLRIPGGR